MSIEYKSIVCEIKAMEDDNIIEGYGAFFNNVDSHREKIQRGAFAKTIKENKNRIKYLWQHDMREPIGKILEIYEDEKGLYLKAKISETDTGKKAMQLVRDGILNEMSIGFETIKDDYETQKNIRTLKEIKLYEVSLVTLASNPMAQVTAYKDFNDTIEQNFDKLNMELKQGRVISKRNIQKIKEAITTLNSLIVDLEPSEDTPKAIDKSNEIEYILRKVREYNN